MEKYGVLYPTQNKDIREKIKKIMLERYNVENPSHCLEFIAKKENSLYSFKNYKMPSGNIRCIQGYENYALNILIERYSENDIITDRKKIPKIMYYFDDDKYKFHYPDIYIQSENKLIEVKSTWTYSIDINKIEAKQEAAILQDYLYEIWVFDIKGNLVSVQ